MSIEKQNTLKWRGNVYTTLYWLLPEVDNMISKMSLFGVEPYNSFIRKQNRLCQERIDKEQLVLGKKLCHPCMMQLFKIKVDYKKIVTQFDYYKFSCSGIAALSRPKD